MPSLEMVTARVGGYSDRLFHHEAVQFEDLQTLAMQLDYAMSEVLADTALSPEKRFAAITMAYGTWLGFLKRLEYEKSADVAQLNTSPYTQSLLRVIDYTYSMSRIEESKLLPQKSTGQ